MYYLMIFALCVAAYCFIADEIKRRKRLKKHNNGDVVDFTEGFRR